MKKKENYCKFIKTVAFIFNCNNSKAIILFKKIVFYIKNRVNIIVPFKILNFNNITKKVIPINNMKKKDIDVIIFIGGDGTLLHIIKKLKDNIPIIGINIGKVGFLADIDPKHAVLEILKLIDGFKYKNVPQLELIINKKHICNFLNEMVLRSINHSQIISYDIYINNYFIKTIFSDGILFSTSIGSTAYALSNGGPLIHPSINVIEIIPIAPFSLISRPLIIPINSEIKIIIRDPLKKVICISDGIVIFKNKKNRIIISNNDTIIIKKYNVPVSFIKIKNSFFYKKINDKLNYNKDN